MDDEWGPTTGYLWMRSCVWENIFKALSPDPDFEYVLVDVSKVHAAYDADHLRQGMDA